MPIAIFYIPNTTSFVCGITVNGSRIYLDFKPQRIGSIMAAAYITNDEEIALAMRKDSYFGKKWFEYKEKAIEKKKSTKPSVAIVDKTTVANQQQAKKYLVMMGYCKANDFAKKTVNQVATENNIVFEAFEKEAPTS